MKFNCSSALRIVAILCALVSTSRGAQMTTIAKFTGSNGSNPYGGLIIDASGNLYGTTFGGGTSGNGTVFRLNAASNYSISRLASFNGSNDANPQGSLLADAAGNLFGSCNTGGSQNYGTMFRLNAASNYSISTLVTFNFTNGYSPYGTLISDAVGNVYGTTASGGSLGSGTVFRLNKASNFSVTTLANFGQTSGIIPVAGVVADAAGNLFGTTQQTAPNGVGTVYKLDASNNYAKSTLVTFNGVNGLSAESELIVDKSGNLYGTTSSGGPFGYGTAFKLDASHNYALTTIAAFDDSSGADPYGGLIMDGAGNLFGTTMGKGGLSSIGTVFKLDASNNYAITTLATMSGSLNREPFARLIADANGNLFGTTIYGGTNDNGTVFEISGAGFVVVPEPSCLALLALAAALGSRRNRRR